MTGILNFLTWALLWVGLFSTEGNVTFKDKGGKKKETEAKPLTTIAFGSCNKNNLPQPLWADIITNNPQLWIWLGGNIDHENSNLKTLETNYQQQLMEPGYSALREATTIIGTWHHNDYGSATAGKEYEHKAESQRLFCDFMGAPEDSPLRKQEGVYSAHTYGPKDQQVKIILLDTRYHRDPAPTEKPEIKGKKKKKKPEADILGEQQWKWLEKELRSNSAELTIIGNGTQVIPDEHSQDKWANYPQSRERLLDLIARTNSKSVILLSGGRHLAEISSLELKGRAQPLYEVTSSGLTHSVGRDYIPEPNRYRVGQVVAKENFGLIKIDWEKREVALLVNGDRNKTYLNQVISF